jgi:hypothetical protein
MRSISPSPLTEPMEPKMLTAYLDQLQDASATAQLVHCLLGALAIGLGPFVPGVIADHVAAYRAAR